MMKRLFWILLVTLLLTGCGPSEALYKDKPTTGTTGAATGAAAETTKTVGMTVQCAIEATDWLSEACKEFEKETGINVLVQGSGSDAALQSVMADTVGLAISYRDLTDEELQSLQATKIGYEAVAVVMHPSNPVTTMNPDEVNAIFSTMILDWQEVGGTPGAIRPIVLPTTTAIRKLFDVSFNVLVESDGKSVSMIPEDMVTSVPTAEEIQALVAADPLAIGFIPVVASDSGLKTLAVNGMNADAASIAAGTYMPSHPVYVVVGKTPDAAVQQLASYLSSDAFGTNLAKIGLLTVQ